MKRLVFVGIMIAALVLSGCGAPKIIEANSGNFSAFITISSKTFEQRFKLTAKGIGNLSFIALDDYSSIDLIWKENHCTSKCGNNSFDIGTHGFESSVFYRIKYILESNYSVECAPDYNGKYIINKAADFGEYRLLLTDDGLPLAINIGDKEKITFKIIDR